ncbi:MAG: nuclear transport factor 2 family protein [Actinomycetia bacterium]|nr:nuclear transport factor 2 family protein [Actinomycetes bacterium]
MSIQAVTNLLGLYCEAMDSADFDAVGALFRDGSLCDAHGNTLVEGADAVAAFYRDSVQLHDGSPCTKHLVMNVIVDDHDDSAGTATLRSSYLVLQGLDGTMAPMITGRYRDTFARDADGWHFTERRFFVDLAGDLSHHLRFDI